MTKHLRANDVRCLIFYEENAGVISSDEEEDKLEIESNSDETDIEEFESENEGDDKVQEIDEDCTLDGDASNNLISHSTSSMSVTSEKSFKKPCLRQAISMQSISSSVIKRSTQKNISKRSQKNKNTNDSLLNHFNNKIYRKVTNAMLKQSILGYEWDTVPDISSFEPIKNLDKNPSLKDQSLNVKNLLTFSIF